MCIIQGKTNFLFKIVVGKFQEMSLWEASKATISLFKTSCVQPIGFPAILEFQLLE
jgi:hypothetical protein